MTATLDREAADATGAKPSLLDRLKTRTTATARQARRGTYYNHPRQWFMRPDGDVVELPGDPESIKYYEDKGYARLRPEEVEEWRGGVRATVVAQQNEKARLLSTIRRIGAKHPGVQVVSDLDDLSTEELKELLAEIGQATGAPVKVIGERFIRTSLPEDEPDARGVELASGDQIEGKKKRAAAQGHASI